MKDFTGPYTSQDGNTAERTYSIYVRDLKRGVETSVNNAGELLWENGLYRGDRPLTGSGLRVIDAQAMFEFVSEIIATDRAAGLLYTSTDQ